MNDTDNLMAKGHSLASRGLVVLGLLLVGLLIVSCACFWWVNQASTQQLNTNHASYQLIHHIQELIPTIREAANGQTKAFDKLTDLQKTIKKDLSDLSQGTTIYGLPAFDNANLDQLRQDWNRYQISIDFILQEKAFLIALHRSGVEAQKIMPEITKNNQALIQILTTENSSLMQRNKAVELAWLTTHISRYIDRLLSNEADAINFTRALENDIRQFDVLLAQLRNGAPSQNLTKLTNVRARRYLESNEQLFAFIKQVSKQLIQNRSKLQNTSQLLASLNMNVRSLTATATSFNQDFQETPVDKAAALFMGYLSLAISVIITILLIQSAKFSLQRQQKVAQNERDNQQQSILRLVNELSHLGHGDLRIQATVTSDVTAAVAESFNFAISALRKLVSSINKIALDVSGTAADTQSIALTMVKSMNQQTKEIMQANNRVKSMAQSIVEVSENASESNRVAETAVNLATAGTKSVKDTIKGMDTIRAQILETSKRIKRLGESSQEIGDIVVLIQDIAERTNLLAINASVSATQAGEEGQGFAVVADEVGELAERVGGAAHQIESLVNTIQTDTNQAVSSMEQSTTQVVEGANLAQKAGEALNEIEKVSSTLATLIGNITKAANQQAATASQVAGTMESIQGVSEQSAKGVADTASIIGKMSSQAKELRLSVAGFKLPQTKTP